MHCTIKMSVHIFKNTTVYILNGINHKNKSLSIDDDKFVVFSLLY